MDLLKEIQKRNNVIIKISITTYDDNLAKFLEPNVISSSKRFEVLNTLRENNIYAGLLMMPILPFVTDTKENIQKCIQLAKESDAKFVYTKMGMILGKRVREYYFQNIDRLYPGLSQDYESVYEKRNVCNPLKYRELLEFFVNECNKNHILCDMSEIINDYKKKFPVKEQISLF